MRNALENLRKRRRQIQRIRRIPFIYSTIVLLLLIYDFGFEQTPFEYIFLQSVYFVAILLGFVSTVGRYFARSTRPKLSVVPFDIFFSFFLAVIISVKLTSAPIDTLLQFLISPFVYYTALLLIFIRELSSVNFSYKRTTVNPAQIFVISFLIIMIIGAFLLMLPNSTYSGIGVVDALFTSTSAVCVTGLAVVDTGTHFTQTGLIIIALLIQIGGLGILTFTSYFSYFFKGGSTFESQLLLRDMVNVGKMSEVFSVLKRIIGVTFVVEAVGALLVFLFLEKTMLPVLSDRVFFAIFHAISGFCNAGFSTLSGGLYEPVIRFNYPVHLIIAFLFILGGMGFPIVFNTVKFLKGKLLNLLYWLFFHQKRFLSPWVLNLNSRVVLYMTFIMIFLGTFLFFILEYSNTLSEHSFFGKIVTAFFNSVTTRTAGFNTIDFSQISIFTVMVVLFLMWVGASPASTGGGIKTSTLAVAVLNIRSLVIGRNKLEVFNRQISQTTINRSYAIIVLSIVMIWMATFLLALFDGAKGMLNLFFETVSAFSTVGLSRGITPSLSIPGKFILILTMFVGRVSMLTLLIAVFKKVANINYRYPDEEILIN